LVKVNAKMMKHEEMMKTQGEQSGRPHNVYSRYGVGILWMIELSQLVPINWQVKYRPRRKGHVMTKLGDFGLRAEEKNKDYPIII
jgi:hypothetical protein